MPAQPTVKGASRSGAAEGSRRTRSGSGPLRTMAMRDGSTPQRSTSTSRWEPFAVTTRSARRHDSRSNPSSTRRTIARPPSADVGAVELGARSWWSKTTGRPASLNSAATRTSVSGGLWAWTASTRWRSAMRIASTRQATVTQTVSNTWPTKPVASGGSRKRRTTTPSMVSVSRLPAPPGPRRRRRIPPRRG